MPRRPRRNHTPVFKSKVALAALKGNKRAAKLAQSFDVHPNQITQMKRMGIRALYRKSKTTNKHPEHPDGEGLRVPGRRDGLVLAQGLVLAGLDHLGRAFLP